MRSLGKTLVISLALMALGSGCIQDVGAAVDRTDDNVFSKAIQNTSQPGTCGTGVTCTHHGDGYQFTSKFELSSAVAFTIGDNADLADGHLIFTFPTGEIVVGGCSTQVSLTLTTGTPTTDTPEICLGTVIATGVVATCGTTGTFENILGPDVATNMAGAVNVLTQIGPTADTAGFVIADGAAHTLHLNIADGWADVDDTAATAGGNIYCSWKWQGDPA